MRKIDKIVGVITCFFLSIVHNTIKIFKTDNIKAHIPKKILFLKISEMGGLVLILPALEEVKKKYPNAKIYFIAFAHNKEMVELLGIANKENIINIRNDHFFVFVWDTIRAIIKIRKLNIDTTIDFEFFARFTNIVSYIGGAKTRVGFFRFHSEGLYRGNLLTHNVQYNYYMHTAEAYLMLVKSLNANLSDIPLVKQKWEHDNLQVKKIISSKKDIDNIYSKILSENKNFDKKNKIVIIAPNSSKMLPLRKWPLNNYILISEMLLAKYPGLYIILIGGNEDLDESEEIQRKVNDKRCILLTGKTSIREIIDLYNISDLLITHDGGPAHFASLTNIRSITLFGTETPLLWRPLSKNNINITANFSCSPCVNIYNQRKSACNNNKCMQAITIKQVYEEAKKILGFKEQKNNIYKIAS